MQRDKHEPTHQDTRFYFRSLSITFSAGSWVSETLLHRIHLQLPQRLK